MFLLSYIENISFSHLIMMISLIIFLIYFLIKVLLEILKKYGFVTYTIGRDYAWYNWLSLVNILFSLAFIVSSYFIGFVDFFQFTISERILLGVVLLDVFVNDTLRMYKNDDIRMYNFNCITDTIVEVITTCNTYTLLTVHLL